MGALGKLPIERISPPFSLHSSFSLPYVFFYSLGLTGGGEWEKNPPNHSAHRGIQTRPIPATSESNHVCMQEFPGPDAREITLEVRRDR